MNRQRCRWNKNRNIICKGKVPMAKSSGKTAPKGSKKRGRQPADKYPFVFDFRRPILDPKREIDFGKAVAEGKQPDPNVGLIPAKAFGDQIRALRAAVAEGKDGPSVNPVYNMIRRGVASDSNATCIVNGQEKLGKPPRKSHEVPEKLRTPWAPGDRVLVDGKDNPIPIRDCHVSDARSLVTNRAENVLTIGKHDFVVGTSDTPAAFLINGSRTGNYAANIRACKSISFNGKSTQDKLTSLVGRFINDWGIITVDDGTTPGAKVAVAPNMVIDGWGYFYRGDSKMTCAQIRAAVEKGDVKGMTFKTVYAPNKEQLVGATMTRSKFWQASKREMGKASTKRMDADGNETTASERFESRDTRGKGKDVRDAADRAFENFFKVQNRTAPDEQYPFGTVSLQTMIVPVTLFGDSLDTPVVRMVIGSFVGAEYSESRGDADYRLNPETYEDYVEPKATKPKAAAKPKAAEKPAAAKPKAAKPKAAAKPAAPKPVAAKPTAPKPTEKPAQSESEAAAEPAPASTPALSVTTE